MKVPQFKPHITQDDYKAMKSCFTSGWITEGPKADEFRVSVCDLVDAKYGAFAPNGTLAIYLALKGCGIGPGDEVIVPDFTFVGSATAVSLTGAKPIFCDVGQDLQINVDSIGGISHSVKAIMPVHIYGMAADMAKVKDWANQYPRMMIIEDAAQALGVTSHGQMCGAVGDAGAFSFFADKTITMGEGGLAVTNYEAIRDRILSHRIKRGTFKQQDISYNLRITDFQAAMGLSQFKRLDEIIRRKRNTYSRYRALLMDVPQIQMVEAPSYSGFVPFRTCIMTQDENYAKPLAEYLEFCGIGVRRFFHPLHLQPCYEDKSILDPPRVSVDVYRRGLMLPSFVDIKDDEICYVANHIKRFYR